jgi:phage repressor protein C with HTH and peptisase S24 domain
MFTHTQIWDAIDGLARDHALSPSGLAKKAGLDSTSFNKSKRINNQGRLRWPSMESIAKILLVTDEPVVKFASRISSHEAAVAVTPRPGTSPDAELGRAAGRL